MDWIYEQLGHLMTSNQFFQGGILLGAITWLGYRLKSIPTFISTKIRWYATYTVHFDEGTEFYRVFAEWLHDNHPRKLRNVEVAFVGEGRHNREGPSPTTQEDDERQRFKLRKTQFSDSNVIRHKGRWLWITKERARVDAARDIFTLFHNSYTISGFFAKRAIEDLLEQIVSRKNAEAEERALQVYYNTNGYFQNRALKVVKTLDHIFFADKSKLLADLGEFVDRKDLYAAKGIKYKRSYLFYGPGGTGKTSLGMAIAKHLNYDLYVINLASIKSDSDLQNQAPNIGKRSVILLEDIDCILSDRKVKSKNLNFSTVLNFLDGLYAPSDCVFVLTTNKPDALDAALTRKGRVDLALHIDFPMVADVEAYMSDFYDADVKLSLAAETRALQGMSAVQDICLQNDLHTACQKVLPIFIVANGHSAQARTVTA